MICSDIILGQYQFRIILKAYRIRNDKVVRVHPLLIGSLEKDTED